MAQFYANIQGSKGKAKRTGTKESGLAGNIRGWGIGVRVYMDYNEETQENECTIWLTCGTSTLPNVKRLGTFTAKDLPVLESFPEDFPDK